MHLVFYPLTITPIGLAPFTIARNRFLMSVALVLGCILSMLEASMFAESIIFSSRMLRKLQESESSCRKHMPYHSTQSDKHSYDIKLVYQRKRSSLER